MSISKKLFLSSMALTAFFMTSKVEAGMVKIRNNSSNNIRVNIIPEPSAGCLPYCWKCFYGSTKSNEAHVKELIIPLDAFRGKEYFAVVGTEGGFLFQGECNNLSVYKNYEISFNETTFNVNCVAKEI